jgi:hypothetical protein
MHSELPGMKVLSVARALSYPLHHLARSSHIGINRSFCLIREEVLVLLQDGLISTLIFV